MTNQVRLTRTELENYRNQGISQSGGKYQRYYCPIHKSDNQRSLQLDPETGRFKCYACGAWGYLEEKRQEWLDKKREECRRNVSWNRKPGKSLLAQSKTPPVTNADSDRQPKARLELLPVLAELQKTLPGGPGEEYLLNRRIPLELAQTYGVGYAAYGKWPHSCNGRPACQWKWGRLVFPHTDPKGNVVNLYGRAVERGYVSREARHDHLPGARGIFNALALLAEIVFICEGVFDAMSLMAASYMNACAIFGVHGLRWDWVKAKRIVFCLDQDAAGSKWQELAWEGLLRGKEIYWLPASVYGSYKDINEVWIATGTIDIGEWSDSSELGEKKSGKDWQIKQPSNNFFPEKARNSFFDCHLENIQGTSRVVMEPVILTNRPAEVRWDDEIPQKNADLLGASDLLSHEGIAIEYLTDRDQAATVVRELVQTAGPLGLNIEIAKLPAFKKHRQAGLDPYLSRIRLIQLYAGGNQVYVFDLDILGLELLQAIWDCVLVAHNAVLELKHLYHVGIDPHRVGCTMLQANALSGTLPSLADLARELLSWDISKEWQKSDWDTAKLSPEQLAYAALRSVAVQKIHQRQMQILEEKRLTRVYILMRDAQRIIARLEGNGCYFDWPGHVHLRKQWEMVKMDALRDLLQILGEDVNPSSGKQVSDWLQMNLDPKIVRAWPRTEIGTLKTDANTLAWFADNALVEPLLRYKEASKRLSTYGDGYVDHIHPVTGRIHATFRLGGTTTGRLSCHSPNIQNPPRDTAFRALFSTPPGRVLVVADYGQIELRVAALVSQDRAMLDVYNQGQDLHRKTAAAITGVAIDKVTNDQRQAAKAINFGLLYGQGDDGLARYARTSYGVKMSKAEAKMARAAFFKTYMGLRQWQQCEARKAQRIQRVITPGGRIRDFTAEASGYRYTEALNTPIQGGAAEVLLAALAKLQIYLDTEEIDARLVNVVHDELVLEVAEGDVDRTQEVVEKAMVEGMRAIFPLSSTLGLVVVHTGRNWAEVK